MIQHTVVSTTNLFRLLEEVAKLLKDGWELDPEHPADTFGFLYEVGLTRVATPDQLAKDAAPTRPEIAAKARAAKAAKKAAREAADGE